MVFTIDRRTWRRGGMDKDHIYGITRLLNSQGYRCCLGFICSQLGVPDDKLLNRETPACISTRDMVGMFVKEDCNYHDNQLTTDAVRINDDGSISDEARESRLIGLFAEHGHELIFED